MEGVTADSSGWSKVVFKVRFNQNCDSMIFDDPIDVSYIPTTSSAVLHIFLSITGPPLHPSIRKFSFLSAVFGGDVDPLLETLQQVFI